MPGDLLPHAMRTLYAAFFVLLAWFLGVLKISLVRGALLNPWPVALPLATIFLLTASFRSSNYAAALVAAAWYWDLPNARLVRPWLSAALAAFVDSPFTLPLVSILLCARAFLMMSAHWRARRTNDALKRLDFTPAQLAMMGAAASERIRTATPKQAAARPAVVPLTGPAAGSAAPSFMDAGGDTQVPRSDAFYDNVSGAPAREPFDLLASRPSHAHHAPRSLLDEDAPESFFGAGGGRRAGPGPGAGAGATPSASARRRAVSPGGPSNTQSPHYAPSSAGAPASSSRRAAAGDGVFDVAGGPSSGWRTLRARGLGLDSHTLGSVASPEATAASFTASHLWSRGAADAAQNVFDGFGSTIAATMARGGASSAVPPKSEDIKVPGDRDWLAADEIASSAAQKRIFVSRNPPDRDTGEATDLGYTDALSSSAYRPASRQPFTGTQRLYDRGGERGNLHFGSSGGGASGSYGGVGGGGGGSGGGGGGSGVTSSGSGGSHIGQPLSLLLRARRLLPDGRGRRAEAAIRNPRDLAALGAGVRKAVAYHFVRRFLPRLAKSSWEFTSRYHWIASNGQWTQNTDKSIKPLSIDTMERRARLPADFRARTAQASQRAALTARSAGATVSATPAELRALCPLAYVDPRAVNMKTSIVRVALDDFIQQRPLNPIHEESIFDRKQDLDSFLDMGRGDVGAAGIDSRGFALARLEALTRASLCAPASAQYKLPTSSNAGKLPPGYCDLFFFSSDNMPDTDLSSFAEAASTGTQAAGGWAPSSPVAMPSDAAILSRYIIGMFNEAAAEAGRSVLECRDAKSHRPRPPHTFDGLFSSYFVDFMGAAGSELGTGARSLLAAAFPGSDSGSRVAFSSDHHPSRCIQLAIAADGPRYGTALKVDGIAYDVAREVRDTSGGLTATFGLFAAALLEEAGGEIAVEPHKYINMRASSLRRSLFL